jgi:hypothetical protein
MVENLKATKDLTFISLLYQDYLTAISILWTVAISLLIAIASYALISIQNLKANISLLIILSVFFLSVLIIFISLHFWISYKKDIFKSKIAHYEIQPPLSK